MEYPLTLAWEFPYHLTDCGQEVTQFTGGLFSQEEIDKDRRARRLTAHVIDTRNEDDHWRSIRNRKIYTFKLRADNAEDRPNLVSAVRSLVNWKPSVHNLTSLAGGNQIAYLAGGGAGRGEITTEMLDKYVEPLLRFKIHQGRRPFKGLRTWRHLNGEHFYHAMVPGDARGIQDRMDDHVTFVMFAGLEHHNYACKVVRCVRDPKLPEYEAWNPNYTDLTKVRAFNWAHWKKQNKAAGPDFDHTEYTDQEQELFKRLREKQAWVCREAKNPFLDPLVIHPDRNPKNLPFEFKICIPDGGKERLVNVLRVGPF